MSKSYLKQTRLYCIVFSDQVAFMLNGSSVNEHNYQYGDNSTARWIQEAHIQCPEQLYALAGIVHNQIVGPFFVNDN